MAISSRTPEGVPHRCPVCGQAAALEPSYPGGDSCCPACGHLLWRVRDQIHETLGVARERIQLGSHFAELGAESLETVELVMQLEEEFGAIPIEDAAQIQTLLDLLRYLRRRWPPDAA